PNLARHPWLALLAAFRTTLEQTPAAAPPADRCWRAGAPGRLSTEVKRSKRSAASHEGDK
ncbi:MAG: hypothetical protein OEV16_06160, partial [Gammaproteobacteria bacterium]|nr:hypothetical protein [Gammaproteobacteria bacterium]